MIPNLTPAERGRHQLSTSRLVNRAVIIHPLNHLGNKKRLQKRTSIYWPLIPFIIAHWAFRSRHSSTQIRQKEEQNTLSLLQNCFVGVCLLFLLLSSWDVVTQAKDSKYPQAYISKKHQLESCSSEIISDLVLLVRIWTFSKDHR